MRIIPGFAILSGLLAPSMAYGGMEREPVVVVDSHRLPAPEDAHILMKGRSASGQFYSVSIDTAPQRPKLAIHASLNKSSLGEVELDLSRYPELEMVPVLGVNAKQIELRVRYGNRRPQCFVNDDGRDRVIVWFDNSKRPTVDVTSFENCLGSMEKRGQ